MKTDGNVKDGSVRQFVGMCTWVNAKPAKQFVARRALGVSATPLAMAHVPTRKASVEIA